MPHQTDFYIARAMFRTMPGRPFGLIGEDFMSHDEACDAINEHFREDGDEGTPTLHNLCVVHITPDAPARDVTEDFIAALFPEREWDAADWAAYDADNEYHAERDAA